MKRYTFKELTELTGEQIIRMSRDESQAVYKYIWSEVKRRLVGTEKRRGILTATVDALLKNPNFAIPKSIAEEIDRENIIPYQKGKGSKKINTQIKKHNLAVIREWEKKQLERLLAPIKGGDGYVGRLHHQIVVMRDFLKSKSATMSGHRKSISKVLNTMKGTLEKLGYETEDISKANIYDIFKVYDMITNRPKGAPKERYELYRNIARIVSENKSRGNYLSLSEIATIINNAREDDYFELIDNDVENESIIDNLNAEEYLEDFNKERFSRFDRRRRS